MSEQLFNPNPKKIIEAFDLLGNIHKRNLENFKFRVGVYGVLFNKDGVLLVRHPKLKSFGLPGGGVEIGENIKTSLIRELKEETGLEIEVGKLMAVMEDYFTYEGEDAHSIMIVYEIKRKGGKILSRGNQDDTGEVKFVNLKKLDEKSTQRVFWPLIKEFKSNINIG